MAWEHFEVTKQGIAKVVNLTTGEISACQYKRGVILTGKSRVFWGYQIIIEIEDNIIIGRHKGYSESYFGALTDCNKKIRQLGLTLLVAGNSPGYNETPLRGGAGYGYIAGKAGPVDILEFCANGSF